MSDMIGRFISLYKAAKETLDHGYEGGHLKHCAQETCTCGYTDLWWAHDAAKRMMAESNRRRTKV